VNIKQVYSRLLTLTHFLSVKITDGEIKETPNSHQSYWEFFDSIAKTIKIRKRNSNKEYEFYYMELIILIGLQASGSEKNRRTQNHKTS
jgi:hypothetical protein